MIQLGERWKTVSCFAREATSGTICTPVAPLPITATLPSSNLSSSSQLAVCITSLVFLQARNFRHMCCMQLANGRNEISAANSVRSWYSSFRVLSRTSIKRPSIVLFPYCLSDSDIETHVPTESPLLSNVDQI